MLTLLNSYRMYRYQTWDIALYELSQERRSTVVASIHPRLRYAFLDDEDNETTLGLFRFREGDDIGPHLALSFPWAPTKGTGPRRVVLDASYTRAPRGVVYSPVDGQEAGVVHAYADGYIAYEPSRIELLGEADVEIERGDNLFTCRRPWRR